MKSNEELIGTTYSHVKYGDFQIIDYENSSRVKIRFIETGFENFVSLGNIKKSKVRDYSIPSICGVGVFDGKYPSKIKGIPVKQHDIWSNMIHRCYNHKKHKVSPTYTKCSVSNSFKNYSYFYEWCEKQIGFSKKGFELDKDLLVKGNSEYSEDTCIFIPTEINLALVKRQAKRGETLIGVSFVKGKYIATVGLGRGKQKKIGIFNTENEAFQAYKQAKEQYLKELAEKWKSKIDPRAYNALINYQVEITD